MIGDRCEPSGHFTSRHQLGDPIVKLLSDTKNQREKENKFKNKYIFAKKTYYYIHRY